MMNTPRVVPIITPVKKATSPLLDDAYPIGILLLIVINQFLQIISSTV